MKSNQPPAVTAMPGVASSLEVNIASDLASVDVMHQGRKPTITLNQNQSNAVNPVVAITSRACPPFCIQPSELTSGVKTIGELEVLSFLKKICDGDEDRAETGVCNLRLCLSRTGIGNASSGDRLHIAAIPFESTRVLWGR